VHEFCSVSTNCGTYLYEPFGAKIALVHWRHYRKHSKGKKAMNVRCSTRISGVLLALLLASAAFPASAHHSAAVFDMSKQISVQGTVEKWVWANPHSWLYIRVVKADGSQEVWGFEAGSTGMLARSGWNAADMKPGDKVTVSGSPERSGNHIGLMNEVQLPSGRVLKAGAGTPPPGLGAPPPGAGATPPGAAGNPPSPR
jgi:Family of unknown function (DUF6152)